MAKPRTFFLLRHYFRNIPTGIRRSLRVLRQNLLQTRLSGSATVDLFSLNLRFDTTPGRAASLFQKKIAFWQHFWRACSLSMSDGCRYAGCNDYTDFDGVTAAGTGIPAQQAVRHQGSARRGLACPRPSISTPGPAMPAAPLPRSQSSGRHLRP